MDQFMKDASVRQQETEVSSVEKRTPIIEV
jgi:hypothetical protein